MSVRLMPSLAYCYFVSHHTLSHSFGGALAGPFADFDKLTAVLYCRFNALSAALSKFQRAFEVGVVHRHADSSESACATAVARTTGANSWRVRTHSQHPRLSRPSSRRHDAANSAHARLFFAWRQHRLFDPVRGLYLRDQVERQGRELELRAAGSTRR